MLTRTFTRLIDAQARWARPLGEWVDGWLAPLLGRTPKLKELLNGTWLGHPLHAAGTDVPIGALTLMVILTLLGQDGAAEVALAVGILAMLAVAVSGSADLVDTHGRERMVTVVHATTMVAALILLVASFVLRIMGDDARGLGVLLGLAGYAVLILGAYVGGEIVFALGYPVDRHAWRSHPQAWQRVEVDEMPEGEPAEGRMGSQPLVLVREGEAVRALHGVCAHAGGPLADGSVENGCAVCPWHGSRFDLVSGARRGGPSLYDQPSYEIRATDDGGLEARAAGGTGGG